MKVVIFAGGLGTRMREETDFRPKPMVEIGSKPVLWHLMKIFSQFGFNEFVILAGYKSHLIKEYFSRMDVYNRDFSIDTSNGRVEFVSGSSENWKVSILDTGPDTLTGERLLLAEPLLTGQTFICTYGDGLAPVNVSDLVNSHVKSQQIATMTVIRPTNRFGVVEFDESGVVEAFREKPMMANWVNMGFFVFGPEIFSYLKRGESLEEGALVRLAMDKKLSVNQYDGFWEPMDTYREYQKLNDLWMKNEAPWKIW